ncbi:hypothetical protein [Streptomyces sp. NPDC058145]|uniref:hypothetical protein n=1 Tax=Streptomyces sp. NPDC058145 TaxID=3346356 RepID=UPI0036E106EE
MLASPAPVVDLVRRRREPVVVRTLRSTGAAVLAYLAGLWLSGNAQPLLAPLTALLVVQVTLYATLTLGIRRIAGVVAELVHGASARRVTAWLEEARRLDHQTADVDAALARAGESLRLNPRGRPAPGARLVLRSGLDAMEHCSVDLRSLCRTFADLRLMNALDIDKRLHASHTEDCPEARRRPTGPRWEVCCVRCGPANCRGGGAVAWIRAGAGRSTAPDDEEHIASWEEQCGTGH